MQSAEVIDLDRAALNAAHKQALASARNIKVEYLKLFDSLLVIERHKAYFDLEITSFELYCTEILELSRNITKDFKIVVRKALEVPQLAEAIRAKGLSLFKARKICSVLTNDNHKEWIDLALTCSTRIVERAVAMANPKELVYESLKPVGAALMEFKIGVSEEWSELLRRTKDVLSQKERRAVSSEEALFVAMQELCARRDPVEKARRAEARTRARRQRTGIESVASFGEPRTSEKNVSTGRHRPASVEHTVNLRDLSQCVHVDANGNRCTSRRWLAKHHVHEFSKGGGHSTENLETLCWAHHRITHLKRERELASRDAGVDRHIEI